MSHSLPEVCCSAPRDSGSAGTNRTPQRKRHRSRHSRSLVCRFAVLTRQFVLTRGPAAASNPRGAALTTYDRYLLGRFAAVFAVFYVAAFGLFAVVDGFMNLDDFQSAADSSAELMVEMGRHYFLQAFVIFDMLGPTLGVTATMVVLAMGLKFGEIHPLLAAGVRGHRVCLPLVTGVLAVAALLAGNRELVLPAIAHRLQGGHAGVARDELSAEPTYDPHGIFIMAEALRPEDRSMREATFRLPAPDVVSDYATLAAESARFVPPRGEGDGGWLLSGVSPPAAQLPLTDEGRRLIVPQTAGVHAGKVFLITPVSFEELCDRARGFKTMSTPDLIRRIRQTPPNDSLAAAQVVHLHDRLASPLLSVIGVMLAGPLIVRRERWNIITNMATCAVVVGLVYGASQVGQMLGRAEMLPADASVWGPLVLGGGVAAWYAAEMRT